MVCCTSCPLPVYMCYFRHSFWIKATRGDELSRYFCADSKDDMLKLIAAIVHAKVWMHGLWYTLRSCVDHVVPAVSQLSQDSNPSRKHSRTIKPSISKSFSPHIRMQGARLSSFLPPPFPRPSLPLSPVPASTVPRHGVQSTIQHFPSTEVVRPAACTTFPSSLPRSFYTLILRSIYPRNCHSVVYAEQPVHGQFMI